MKTFKHLIGPIEAQFSTNEEDGKSYLEGYAVKYNLPTKSKRFDRKNGKPFHYMIASGAFDHILGNEESDVALVYNHDDSKIMARTTNGTLSLSSDEEGVMFKAEIADVSYARDVYKLIQRGDLSHMSFRVIFKESDLKDFTDDNGEPIRLVEKVEQFMEISVVLFPAFSNTSVIAASESEEEE